MLTKMYIKETFHDYLQLLLWFLRDMSTWAKVLQTAIF